MKYFVSVFLLFVLILSGCGSTGGSSERENTFRSNLGTATEHDLRLKVPLYITRTGYTLYREEVTLDGTYFETEWRERDLFDDERAMGVEAARTKIIITSRPREAQATSLQRVNIEIFNHVKMPGEEGWIRTILTDEARDYYRDFTRRLNQELDSGVRRT
jgi:hypothetical protein